MTDIEKIKAELQDLLERSQNDGRIFSTSIPIATIQAIVAALAVPALEKEGVVEARRGVP